MKKNKKPLKLYNENQGVHYALLVNPKKEQAQVKDICVEMPTSRHY